MRKDRQKDRKGSRRGRLVNQLGETQLVETILSRFCGEGTRRVLVGPGDDAAVVKLDRGSPLILTTDVLVEGTHFSLDFSYPEAIGFKAVTANLSDVAAMGGQPFGIVVSLGIPRTIPVRAVNRIYAGISRALSLFGGELLGGDTVRSRAVTVCVSAVGELVGKTPFLRSGARPGDAICVTGTLGGSEMGLKLLKKYFKGKPRSRDSSLTSWSDRTAGYFREKLPASVRKNGHACISRHLLPRPRVTEAGVLSSYDLSAAIDISDGLLIDVARIAKASDVGVLLREEQVPVSRDCEAVARSLGVSAYDVALSSGEEYEILFAVAPAKVRQITRTLANRCGTGVTVLGEVVEKRRGAFVAGRRGRRKRLLERGFEHF
ncbi:MAG: hypothetical protein AMJ46_02945 [Latescibacteria bacterium DG_63]|nr:MAG: hypothetical protein AMJ46_02945 [Latescibacteria bacterium DG_63]